MSSGVKTPDGRSTADLLHSAAVRLLRGLRTTDGQAGLSPAQASVISVLVYGGPGSITRLAAAEQVRVPTMSRLVKDLEVAGLVTRSADGGDARASVIEVAPKGRALFETARNRRLGRLESALADCSDEDRALLTRAAPRLLELAGRIR